MVFESIVVDLINRYLGDYVAKLDKSQLKLGLLGGNATLENLDIKDSAFDEFNLPIKVHQGHISKLTLKIPWKHLYSEPVIAELDGLYILVLPNAEVKYDAEKERLYKLEAKQKEISRIEENKIKRKEQKTEVKDSFGEKLAAQIIKNLQISISNIHIRYEDTTTNPQRPFSVGITLANLSFQTCDENGMSIVIKDDLTKEFYKSVKMDSLAVYWNSNAKLFSKENRATLKAVMKNNISSSERKLKDNNFMIKPISCSAKMHVHMKPETINFSMPRISLALSMDQIGFAFNRNQYCDLANFLDSIDRSWTKSRYRKYRPYVPFKSNVKIWWKFPYSVILEEQVRRRRRMWSWEFIRAHRNQCRIYTDLWEQKLLDKKWTVAEQEQVDKCEEYLDLLNITLCRQKAEMKVKKMKKKLGDKKSENKGWFSGWFGKSNAELISKETEDIQKKILHEFTQEEKESLYQAIGYSEQSNDPDIPKDYVSLKLNLELQKLTFLLSDDSLNEHKLMKLTIFSMSSNIEQRSSAEAVKVGLMMNSMQVMGSKHSDGTTPTLVSSQCQSTKPNLLVVDFETNPLDQSANQKINVRAEPLEIIYDSETINRVVKFFIPPEELQLFELSNQVRASIEEVKEMTATGLRHLADQRLYTDIKVDIKPSYFILPEMGIFKKDCKMLLFDLGSVLVNSERTNVPGSGDSNPSKKDEKLGYEIIKETAYDKFHITLSKIQIILVERGDDWKMLRTLESSKNHIFKPFGFDFDLKKCTIINDAVLPKVIINGCLPILGISISDKVLQSVLELVLHIPFPQTTQKPIITSDTLLKDLNKTSLNMLPLNNMTSNQVMRAININPDSETSSLMSSIDNDDEDDEFKDAVEDFGDQTDNKKKEIEKISKKLNLTDLCAMFVIKTVELHVIEESKNPTEDTMALKDIIKLVVNDIGTTVTLKRFDMHFQAYIDSVSLAVPQYLDPITTLPICLVKIDQHTIGHNLSVNLVIAEKTAPDFLTTYKNTRHHLQCEFKSLEVCLHQEALLVLLNFMNSLTPILNPVTSDKSDNWSSIIGDESGSKKISERQINILEDKKKGLRDTSVLGVITEKAELNTEKRNVRLNAETEAERMGIKLNIPENSIIQWEVNANLERLSVVVANERDNKFLEMFIQGMRADISVNYSMTSINLCIMDMQIHDITPQAFYKKIIWIDAEESIFSMQLVIFSQGTSTPGFELDLSKIDHHVSLQVGKIKIVFLYSLVVRIQNFLNTFQDALKSVTEKTQQYSESVSNKLTNVLDEPPSTRTKLDINVNAPVIIIPENSKSTNALIVDLGALQFKNSFDIANSKIVLEKSEIILNNLKISRSILMETKVKSEKGILRPINIHVNMIRNLSWNSNQSIPQIDILANMNYISVGMSQGDYHVVRLVLESNFTESVDQSTNIPNKIDQHPIPSSKKDTATEDKNSGVLGSNNEEIVSVRFAFKMEYLDVELFKGDSIPDYWALDILPERNLTKMKCDKLSLDGCIHVDTSINVDVKLSSISLVDTQPSSASKINEYIRSGKGDEKDFIAVKFNRYKIGNSKLNVDVAGIYMCICVDFITQIADFFVKTELPKQISDQNQRKIKQKPQLKAVEPRVSDFEIDLKVERPEILLVENIENPKSNAIMIQTNLSLKYSVLKNTDILEANISNFGAIFCPFVKEFRKKTNLNIISPTNLDLFICKPIDERMQGSLTIGQLIINITPAVIHSISKIASTLKVAKTEDCSSSEKSSSYDQTEAFVEQFWEMKKFKETDFPFLSKELTSEEVEHGIDIVATLDDTPKLDDQIDVQLVSIQVILQSEFTKKCVPMLILECSMNGNLKNPLNQLCIGLTTCMSMSYFNDQINVWEPLIETYPENNRQYTLEFKYLTSDDSQFLDAEDSEDMINIRPPNVSISLSSNDNLELTLSKTALGILSNLGKIFEDAYTLRLTDHKAVVGAPYVIKNNCGKDIVFHINNEFDLRRFNSDKEIELVLKANEEIQLYDAKVDKQISITGKKQSRLVKFGFANTKDREYITICKSETRGFAFRSKEASPTTKYTSNESDINTLIISTSAYLGMKQIDLRSIVQVLNNTEDILSLYYSMYNNVKETREFVLIEDVEPRKICNIPIPALINSGGNFFISVKELGTGISTTGATWIVGKNSQIPESQILTCKASSGVVYYYSFALNVEEIPFVYSSEESTGNTYKLTVNVPLILQNQLPIQINYESQMFGHKVEPGCQHVVRTACRKFPSILKISYEYQKKEWSGTLELGPKLEEHNEISFKINDDKEELSMNLGVYMVNKNGQTTLTVYSPYWMINKTGFTLEYKTGVNCISKHEESNKDAVLFSLPQKEKVLIKINDSSWSDKFSLDTVGSSGKVVCKNKAMNYEVGVKINLSGSGLTKIVTFLPYYMILNQSHIVLLCNEMVENAGWITVPPGEAVPFWPRSEVGKSMMMRCKVEDREVLETQPFPFYESHSILLKLKKKFIGIFVEVQITEEANLINLQLYQEGMVPVQLINHLGEDVIIHYHQIGTQKEVDLPASNTVMYAWQDGTQKRELIWRVEGDNKKQHSNTLTSDGKEEFFIKGMKAYCISFVWDSYRILLFTNDIHVAKHARLSADLENIDQEITISLQSIGLSLVDNALKQELAYISITSSGVKWNQISKKNILKPLKLAQSEALETSFQEFLKLPSDNKTKEYIVKVEGLEVDLSKKIMLSPKSCTLNRMIEPGISLQYRTTLHQIHAHLKIFKIQIDNQMSGCSFPVVFAPFPPPASVAMDTGLKPLIELSAVIIKSGATDSLRFKYFGILIQEMQLMLDQNFINSIVDMMSDNVPLSDEEAMFKKDYQMIQDSLIDTSTIKSILQGKQKYVLDIFHISPIKIHLSFSLTHSNRTEKSAFFLQALRIFLQSVGTVVTDVQDVIFKLGYFEKQSSIMSKDQILLSVKTHYISQALRQMYVLVLGLDCLGNPFGVIRGVAQGVEDLFYEPIKGAILGPEEFVEGVAYGVRSLFGHAVGGAAGAVSRITGTVGKKVATLTFDSDYQRKRQEQLTKRPENFGVGLVQGGKNLVTGIFQGVTGIVTKPIDGAKKEGFEGFFKGVGKGLVGVVTRPVSGVVDFASSSLEGIKKVVETNVQVYRIRLPRYIANDGIIRPYDLREAEGSSIWNKIIEKCYPQKNESYIFHIYSKPKNVIFLTNKRVFHVERNEILAIWSIQWQIGYNKLDGPPVYNETKRAIIFTLKEKQINIFSKDSITKEIETDVKVSKEDIRKLVEKFLQFKNEISKS